MRKLAAIKNALWLVPDKKNNVFVSLSSCIEKCNINVVLYDYTDFFIQNGINLLHEDILNRIHNMDVATSVVFVSFYGDSFLLTPEFLRVISSKINIIAWAFDDEMYSTTTSIYFYQSVHAVMTTDFFGRGLLESLGVPTLYFPAPPWMKTDEHPYAPKKTLDIVFCGDCVKSERKFYIEKLRENGFFVETYGTGSKNGYISYEKMIESYAASKICLNFSGVTVNPSILYNEPWRQYIRQVKGRPFEICAAGSLCLTEWAPALEQSFIIGKEIECFADAQELVQKVSFYLDNETAREEIARNGHKKALQFMNLDYIKYLLAQLEQTIASKNNHLLSQPIFRSTSFRRLEMYHMSILILHRIKNRKFIGTYESAKCFCFFKFSYSNILNVAIVFFRVLHKVFLRYQCKL